MSSQKELLIDFIDWVKENAKDAWDVYENTEELVEEYLTEMES